MLNISQLVEQTLVDAGIPHMGEPNIKLICDRLTNQSRTDSVGNVIPISQQEIIWLSMREDRQSKLPPPPSGSTIKQSPMIGRSVNPALLPAWLLAATKKRHKAEKVDAATGFVVLGEFEFSAIAQHRIKVFTLKRGTLVKGIFTEIR